MKLTQQTSGPDGERWLDVLMMLVANRRSLWRLGLGSPPLAEPMLVAGLHQRYTHQARARTELDG
jgi:hypothetical protein